jgi:hypothetical protein
MLTPILQEQKAIINKTVMEILKNRFNRADFFIFIFLNLRLLIYRTIQTTEARGQKTEQKTEARRQKTDNERLDFS